MSLNLFLISMKCRNGLSGAESMVVASVLDRLGVSGH